MMKQFRSSLTHSLIIGVAFLTCAFAQATAPSRLEFTTPGGWTQSIDPETKLPSLHPPGRHAVLTFSESTETTGSAENWLATVWAEMTTQMKPVGNASGGREGDFTMRSSECVKPDGSRPWLRVYALVKDGRGESVIFIAANQQVFLSLLPTVTPMVRGMKVTTPAAGERAAATSAVSPPAPAAMMPVLAYNEPAGYYRGAGSSPIEYSSNEVNAGIQIYPFRAYSGDIVAAFQRTLLRDWIAPQFRENALAAAPQIGASRIPGSTRALSARFRENIGGTLNERMRLLIIADNQAALVDVSANSSYSWQRSGPVMMAMLDSIRVERKPAPPPVSGGPGPGGASIAGLYMGMKSKFVSGILGITGASMQPALHYYLFSADGRFHCCYDFPPGGNGTAWKRFDFDAAQRTDPQNTGRYTIRGDQVFLQTRSESFVGAIRDANTVHIQSVTYERQP